MVFLSTLAYSINANPDLIQVLLAFATVPELRQINMPQYTTFLKELEYSPSKTRLTKHFESYARDFEDCPESRMLGANRRQYHTAVDARVKICVEHLMNQWPKSEISIPDYDDLAIYVDVEKAMAGARGLFLDWYCNSEFQDYTRRIQAVVDRCSEYPSPDRLSIVVPKLSYQAIKGYVTFGDLLLNTAPTQIGQGFAQNVQDLVRYTQESISSQFSAPSLVQNQEKLGQLLRDLAQRASGTYEKTYINDLGRSHDAFKQDIIQPSIATEVFQTLLERNLNESRLQVDKMYKTILSHLLRPVNSAHNMSRLALMLPRLSPSIVLSYLAQSLRAMLSDDWKVVVVQFGVAITSLQRAERLVACAGSRAELLSELSNPGHLEWSPLEYPDWLLLEVENNILIRSEQAQIAKQMISPMSGRNSIMQLNMGLGKSSVIVPIVAATLADGKRLARVVVLKSLATQMFQLLLKRLGGLINRRIFFLPISRSLALNARVARDIRKIYEDCMRRGGVLLVQPEHLLSFELLGLDASIGQASKGSGIKSSEVSVGKMMIETQSKFSFIFPFSELCSSLILRCFELLTLISSRVAFGKFS
jgi:hypothetical protein